MKLLRIVPIAFLLAASLTACGKAKAKTEGEKLVDQMEAMATAVCACPKEDMTCMGKAMADEDAVEAKMEKEWADESKVPADLAKRMDAAEAKAEACAKGEAPAAGSGSGTGTGAQRIERLTPDQEKLLVDLAGVKDKACACTDKACFDKAVEDGNQFNARLDDLYEDETKVPPEVKVQIDTIQKQVEECAVKIGGETPAFDPAVAAVLAEFDALKEEICKCADKACAETAMNKGEALEDKLKAASPGATIPEAVVARMQEVESAVNDCVSKLP